jgi:hypothetical protein
VRIKPEENPVAIATISDTLQSFNRKERYWLVRNCLGSAPLNESFLKRLSYELSSRDVQPIPSTAWWAVDYHLNWVIAAIRWHVLAPNWEVQDNDKNLVQGNQEDIDLIIANGKDLILVEAKFDGWNKDDCKQLNSKLGRLSALCDDTTGNVLDTSLRMHFVLMSQKKPDARKLENVEWPHWAIHGELPYRLILEVAPIPHLTCFRCNEEKRKDKVGGHWTVRNSR